MCVCICCSVQTGQQQISLGKRHVWTLLAHVGLSRLIKSPSTYVASYCTCRPNYALLMFRFKNGWISVNFNQTASTLINSASGVSGVNATRRTRAQQQIQGRRPVLQIGTDKRRGNVQQREWKSSSGGVSADVRPKGDDERIHKVSGPAGQQDGYHGNTQRIHRVSGVRGHVPCVYVPSSHSVQ